MSTFLRPTGTRFSPSFTRRSTPAPDVLKKAFVIFPVKAAIEDRHLYQHVQSAFSAIPDLPFKHISAVQRLGASTRVAITCSDPEERAAFLRRKQDISAACKWVVDAYLTHAQLQRHETQAHYHALLDSLGMHPHWKLDQLCFIQDGQSKPFKPLSAFARSILKKAHSFSAPPQVQQTQHDVTDNCCMDASADDEEPPIQCITSMDEDHSSCHSDSLNSEDTQTHATADVEICSHTQVSQDQPHKLPIPFAPYAVHTPLYLPESSPPSHVGLQQVSEKRNAALQTVNAAWKSEITRLVKLTNQDSNHSALLQDIRSFHPRLQGLLHAAGPPKDSTDQLSMTRTGLIQSGMCFLKDLDDFVNDQYIPREVDESNILTVIKGLDDLFNYSVYLGDHKYTWKAG